MRPSKHFNSFAAASRYCIPALKKSFLIMRHAGIVPQPSIFYFIFIYLFIIIYFFFGGGGGGNLITRYAFFSLM